MLPRCGHSNLSYLLTRLGWWGEGVADHLNIGNPWSVTPYRRTAVPPYRRTATSGALAAELRVAELEKMVL